MADPFQIRPARPADVPALGQLERACFTDPWTDRSLAEAVRSELGVAFVAMDRGQVAGYVLARHAGGSGEILNLAVAPATRRTGVGRALLEAALGGLAGVGVTEVFLEVRESNGGALALYQGRGFRIAGTRRGYYRLPDEDALVLRLDLPLSG